MTTLIREERITIPMARLGPPSNLPRFRWQQPMPNRPTPPNFGLTDEESSHGFTWGEDSILPYEVSDGYDREVRPGTLDCIVIENGRLRAVVAPSLGGRLLDLQEIDIAGTQAEGKDVDSASVQYRAQYFTPRDDWFTILGQGGAEF